MKFNCYFLRTADESLYLFCERDGCDYSGLLRAVPVVRTADDVLDGLGFALNLTMPRKNGYFIERDTLSPIGGALATLGSQWCSGKQCSEAHSLDEAASRLEAWGMSHLSATMMEAAERVTTTTLKDAIRAAMEQNTTHVYLANFSYILGELHSVLSASESRALNNLARLYDGSDSATDFAVGCTSADIEELLQYAEVLPATSKVGLLAFAAIYNIACGNPAEVGDNRQKILRAFN